MKVKMLQSNMAIRVKRPKSENVTVKYGKQILVTMIARISRDQKGVEHHFLMHSYQQICHEILLTEIEK